MRKCTNISFSPILYRTFYLLTPPSELPPLPQSLHKTGEAPSVTDDTPPRNPSYLPIHLYTLLQIIITVAIFILTLTRGAPAFPVLIIALVPFRLLVMNRWWPREVLRFVDAWACREGTPEDDEDAQAKDERPDEETFDTSSPPTGGILSSGVDTEARSLSPVQESSTAPKQPGGSRIHATSQRAQGTANDDTSNEWVELEERGLPGEELGA